MHKLLAISHWPSFFRGNEYDADNTVVYFNSYDPNDVNRKYSNRLPPSPHRVLPRML